MAHLLWVIPLKMVIFHCDASLPEGKSSFSYDFLMVFLWFSHFTIILRMIHLATLHPWHPQTLATVWLRQGCHKQVAVIPKAERSTCADRRRDMRWPGFLGLAWRIIEKGPQRFVNEHASSCFIQIGSLHVIAYVEEPNGYYIWPDLSKLVICHYQDAISQW